MSDSDGKQIQMDLASVVYIILLWNSSHCHIAYTVSVAYCNDVEVKSEWDTERLPFLNILSDK